MKNNGKGRDRRDVNRKKEKNGRKNENWKAAREKKYILVDGEQREKERQQEM